MTTADLQSTYNAVYAADELSFHTLDNWEESLLLYHMGGDWRGKRVLEIGCGRGRLSALIAMSGAMDVLGMDYSQEAIDIASRSFRLAGLTFTTNALELISGGWDVVLMQGVLEHQDDWQAYLDNLLRYIRPSGCILTSSPNMLNPRGCIWQALRLLLNVPMSLTDLHCISVPDMLRWAASRGCEISYDSCHHDWAAGRLMLVDYAKRLPNALRDAGLDTSRVPLLLDWLRMQLDFYQPQPWSGASVAYRITRYPLCGPAGSATPAAHGICTAGPVVAPPASS